MLLRRHLGVLVAPVMVLMGLLLPWSPAQAAGGIEVDVEGGALSFERLAPGYGRTAAVRVSNQSEYDADLTLRVSDVVDDDDGCVRQEIRDGDVTCDAAGGELSSWLRLAIHRDGVSLWEGPMSTLVADGAVIGEAVPAGSDLPLTVSVMLPSGAGNDTMTDRVSFSLRIDATADTDTDAAILGAALVGGPSDSDVLGVEAAAGAATGDRGGIAGLLPETGAGVGSWLPWVGAFLLGSGGYLLISGRRRDPRPA
ncbi:MAG: LPXTG cell wall anchor domain-containing protein [Nocardioides sp.]